ncbi:MAG: DUF5911 domain-containing protein, partial [Actinomycetota bacterium]|nr:DUF5911 domain-containing protein [Actinomycetota bacterium]
MASRIEDYALLSDLHTGPLVSRTGSVDWLCFPRFDSPSLFGALVGTEENGRWLLAPLAADAVVVRRGYVDGTFVLQTDWHADGGSVRVTEFMPVGDRRASLVRRVEGLSGSVRMHQEIKIRFGYGTVLPWMSRMPDAEGNQVLLAVAGPDALVLRGDVLPVAADHKHSGEFIVAAGQTVDLELTWYPSHRQVPAGIEVDVALA